MKKQTKSNYPDVLKMVVKTTKSKPNVPTDKQITKAINER